MPTKVFISWSGDLSRKLGEALRDWLPKALQSAKPYFSPKDIDKGTRWDAEVAGALEESDIGIICVTPDNTERPWILFEAGALSKALDKARVCPLLFGLKPADVGGPLASFQLTQFEKEDFRKLVAAINDALGESKLADGDFADVFDMWWPRLKTNVVEIQEGHEQGPAPKHRSDRDVLEEILAKVRSIENRDLRGSRPDLLRRLFVAAKASGQDGPQDRPSFYDDEIVRSLGGVLNRDGSWRADVDAATKDDGEAPA